MELSEFTSPAVNKSEIYIAVELEPELKLSDMECQEWQCAVKSAMTMHRGRKEWSPGNKVKVPVRLRHLLNFHSLIGFVDKLFNIHT